MALSRILGVWGKDGTQQRNGINLYDTEQFRSPLPNIGVGGVVGGGGGLPNTTVAMQQLRAFVNSMGENIVANRKLNIEKEIADAEMNVALGMVHKGFWTNGQPVTVLRADGGECNGTIALLPITKN